MDDDARLQAIEDFGEPVKRCSRCKEWLPLDGEFYPHGGSSVWSPWCKACWSEHRVWKREEARQKR